MQRLPHSKPLFGCHAFGAFALDLRDLGRRSGGVTAAQAASIVTGALVARIAQSILTNADALRRGGLEGARDALRGLVR